MGLEASLATDIGEWRSMEYGKGVANIVRDLSLYCNLVADGDALDIVAEYQTLEIPGELPLCAGIQVLGRAQWHPELDYTEDDYERYVRDFSNQPDFRDENLTREAFDDLIRRGKEAFVPLDEMTGSVRLILSRLQKVTLQEFGREILPDYITALEQLLDALIDLKQAGAQRVCVMIS